MESIRSERSVTATTSTHCSSRTEKVYMCPRGIWLHRGNPQKCGRQCNTAQEDKRVEYENVPMMDVVTVEKIFFRQNVCRAE